MKLSYPKTTFRVQCFNQVVDRALQILEPQFEQLKKHLFGFWFNFQDLPNDRKCTIEVTLT